MSLEVRIYGRRTGPGREAERTIGAERRRSTIVMAAIAARSIFKAAIAARSRPHGVTSICG